MTQEEWEKQWAEWEAMTPEQRAEHLAQQLKAQENETAPF